MSTQLNKDVNIIANSDLEITYFEGDVNIIQKLDDEPNDVGGLSSAELKAKFDEGSNIIKKFINESLIPELLAADATEATRAAAESERVSGEAGRVAAETARVEAETSRQTNEATRGTQETQRTTAEQERVAAEAARKAAEEGRVAAEKLRVASENNRSAAEQSRATAESGRAATEESRASAESDRVAGEAARENAENSRANAEARRVDAETARAAAFATLKSESEKAITAANSAADKVDNMTAGSETLAPGSNAAVEKSTNADGGIHLKFGIPKGRQGETGNGIQSIAKTAGTGAAGTYDTHTVTMTDGSKYSFKVYNGANGKDGDGSGDMTRETYDPQGKAQDIFKYAEEHGGVQSDWSQNDETAKDYVKNRTHYINTEAQVVYEATTETKIGYPYVWLFEGALESGTTYIVEFDGVTYEMVAKETPATENTVGMVYIGNLSLEDNTTEDTGEPLCMYNSGSRVALKTSDYTFKGSGVYEVPMKGLIITGMFQKYIPLDEKYLPDTALLKSGGTMTGQLTLSSDPTSKLHAATKQYVDNKVKPATIKVKLTSAGWDSTALTQTVTAAGVLADETAQMLTVSPALASQAAYYEAGILCTGQAADSLTFTAETVPTESLTVYVVMQAVIPPPPVTKIAFGIEDKSYEAEEGMTWAQWVNSEYNTDQFVDTGSRILDSTRSYEVYMSEGRGPVSNLHEIMNAEGYLLVSNGSSD